MVEKVETVEPHFALEGEGLRTHTNYLGKSTWVPKTMNIFYGLLEFALDPLPRYRVDINYDRPCKWYGL